MSEEFIGDGYEYEDDNYYSDKNGRWFTKYGLNTGGMDTSKWVDPTKRDSESTHPYNFSEYFLIGNHAKIKKAEKTSKVATVYSDRLFQWDTVRHDLLFKKHLSGVGYKSSPEKISEFLLEYFGIYKSVEVVAVAKGCNQSSGFPYWLIWYAHTDHPKKKQEKIRTALANERIKIQNDRDIASKNTWMVDRMRNALSAIDTFSMSVDDYPILYKTKSENILARLETTNTVEIKKVAKMVVNFLDALEKKYGNKMFFFRVKEVSDKMKINVEHFNDKEYHPWK